jgi:hypothetical protein
LQQGRIKREKLRSLTLSIAKPRTMHIRHLNPDQKKALAKHSKKKGYPEPKGKFNIKKKNHVQTRAKDVDTAIYYPNRTHSRQ